MGKLEQLGTAALAKATKEIRTVGKRIAVEVSVMKDQVARVNKRMSADHGGDNWLSYKESEIMMDGSLLPNVQVTWPRASKP